MAYAKELVQAGLSAGTAKGIGGQYTTKAATGSTQANAATLTASMTVVTAADGTKGVALTGEIGDSVWVFNDSGSTLKVYPNADAAIAVPGTGLGTVDAAYSHTTYATCIYKRLTATQWLVNKSA